MLIFFGVEKSRELGINWSVGFGYSVWVDSKIKMVVVLCRKKNNNNNNDKKVKILCYKEWILIIFVFVFE